MTIHTLELSRATLHGKFSRELEPVLRINPGDTVRFSTLDAGWGVEQHRVDGSQRRLFEPRDPERDAGHALCGPVHINGAEAGMTLEVRIDKVVPGSWGWNSGGGWASKVNTRLGVAELERFTNRWDLDLDRMVGRTQKGFEVLLRPFMGVMGMPPDEPGLHSTAPPRATGGNMDCKELVPRSSLFLPVAVDGGLFSTGDGHAAQGDGEVSCTAIECPMDLAELTFFLHPELSLKLPRANTPAGWVTMGFDEDLNEATYLAIDGMLELLDSQYDISRQEALALASVAVEIRVTQIVNGVCGVHALLPHGSLLRTAG